MGLVTLIYAVISGIVGGLIGAFIITLIRRFRKPKSSVGWDLLTFFISFCICGLISAVFVGFIMVMAFTGGFS
jgi:uncharacterized Tic20 family protein